MFSTNCSKVKSDPNISKIGTGINVDFILHMGSDGSFTVFSELERPSFLCTGVQKWMLNCDTLKLTWKSCQCMTWWWDVLLEGLRPTSARDPWTSRAAYPPLIQSLSVGGCETSSPSVCCCALGKIQKVLASFIQKYTYNKKLNFFLNFFLNIMHFKIIFTLLRNL